MRIKTIAVLGMLLLAGCSGGANGGNGSDGSAGKDGKAGTDGKDGAPGAPGPAGKDAAASGSRIKARWQVAEDGARQFVGFFDSELQEPCGFSVASDGVTRCLPLSPGATRLFTDASCSSPAFFNIFQGCGLGKYALVPLATDCAFEQRAEIHKLGTKLDSAATYYVSNAPNTCVVWNLGPNYDYFADDGLVDPSMFVAATIETDP